MGKEYGKIEGSIRLGKGLDLYGMVTGTITVLNGGTLNLYGTCNRLVVEAGGRATVFGTVATEAINRGGYLEIYGVVGESLEDLDGETFVHPDAVTGARS